MNTLWNAMVSVASWPIETVASAIEGTGAWACGWAVILVAAGWRLLLLPLLVRQGNRRILTARWHAVHSRGRDMRDREQRAAVRRQVTDSLAGQVAPTGRLAGVATALQVLAIVAVAIWSRGSDTAAEHGFAGLARLDAMTATLGAAGWAWALALGLAFLATALVTHGAAGNTAGHQGVIDRAITPAFFTGLALLLPAGVTVAFVAGMAVSMIGLVIASASVPTGARATAGQVA